MNNPLNVNGSIRTCSGAYVNFLDIDPHTLLIEDIAFALSKEQRFGNHLPIEYSVAQHCVEAAKKGKTDKFEKLMHDTSEAFLRDMPSPIKKLLKDYQILEDKVNIALSEKFGFTYPFSEDLHKIDKELLEFEWEHIMLGKPLPNGKQFKGWGQKKAEREFLKMFNKLKPKGY